MKGTLIWIASVAAIAYFASILLLYLFQRSFLYFPDDRWFEPAEVGLNGYETVEIRAAPARLRSWWRAPPKPGAPVILHFHGNGGSIAGRAGMYAALAGEDYGMLAAEYPGYAGNDGDVSEAALFASAAAHYDWLIARGRLLVN